jgi:hypothetical protein
MQRHLLAVLLVVVSASSVAESQEYDRIDITGRLGADQRPFELRLRCAPYSAERDAGVSHFWGGDSPGFHPSTVITSLRFTLEKRSMSIPREAFSDLGDTDVPNGPFPSGDHGEIILILHGGDAAGGYTCNFFFREGKLVRREIYGYLAKKPSEVKHFP